MIMTPGRQLVSATYGLRQGSAKGTTDYLLHFQAGLNDALGITNPLWDQWVILRDVGTDGKPRKVDVYLNETAARKSWAESEKDT